MNIFFIYLNSMHSFSCVLEKKITSISNPGSHRYKLYFKNKFKLKGELEWFQGREERELTGKVHFCREGNVLY